MTALYEIKGVNVVDTPPSKIAEEFKRYTEDKAEEQKEIDWVELIHQTTLFDPDKGYEQLIHTSEPAERKASRRRQKPESESSEEDQAK